MGKQKIAIVINGERRKLGRTPPLHAIVFFLVVHSEYNNTNLYFTLSFINYRLPPIIPTFNLIVLLRWINKAFI